MPYVFEKNQITKSEKIRMDSRFFIDDFNFNRAIANLNISKYKICTVKLNDIFMGIDGKYFHIYETDAYKFINGGDRETERYMAYCNKYGKNNPNRNKETYIKLIEEFKEYDIKKGAILIDECNILLDGQHRCCLLISKYGLDYSIFAVKVYTHGFHVKKRIGIMKLKIIDWLKCAK